MRAERIAVGEDGRIPLPDGYRGAEIVAEHHEDGVTLWRVRPDARRVYIEPTARCNLDCAICVRQVCRDTLGEMSWEMYRVVIEHLRAFPDLRTLTLGGFGEPLAHPRIVEMVAAAAALGLRVTLATNGLLLDRPMAEALLEARLDTLVVSVDAAHIQAFERAGVVGGLDRVLDNVQTLRGLARQRGLMAPRIGLEYVVTRSNLTNLARLPTLAATLGASFALVTHLLPHTAEQADDVLYDCNEPLPVPAGWPVASADWVIWGLARLPRMRWGAHRRCRFVEERALVIAWDGVVSPCYPLMHSYPYYVYGRRKDVTRYILGRVGERSLAEIWTSRESVLFRAKVRGFRFPSCVDCGMACTYASRNEDCWGNVPSCADCLWAQDIVRCP